MVEDVHDVTFESLSDNGWDIKNILNEFVEMKKKNKSWAESETITRAYNRNIKFYYSW